MTTPFGPPQTRSPSRTVLVVSILVGLFTVCSVGSLAARVLPGFLKPPHQDQREVKANLKYAFTAERAYFQEKDEYRADFGEVGFVPERGNRYLYLVDASAGIWVPGDPGLPHGIIAPDAHGGFYPYLGVSLAVPMGHDITFIGSVSYEWSFDQRRGGFVVVATLDFLVNEHLGIDLNLAFIHDQPGLRFAEADFFLGAAQGSPCCWESGRSRRS